MMDEKTKLLLALMQIENVISLVQGNEYEKFFISQLSPTLYELKRQLTNLTHSTKLKK